MRDVQCGAPICTFFLNLLDQGFGRCEILTHVAIINYSNYYSYMEVS